MGTAWDLSPAASFTNTGTGFGWWPVRGGYYGVAFKVFWGVAQGYPLSRNIFNVVVDAVVHH